MNYLKLILCMAILSVSCQNNPIKKVDFNQYLSDLNCWDGDENRYKGVGIFVGEYDQVFYMFSSKCSTDDYGYKYGAFSDIWIIRLSDKKGVLQAFLKNGENISENFHLPRRAPKLDEFVFLSDMETRAIVSNGYEYLEIIKINRLKKTPITYGELVDDYVGTMKKLRAMEDGQ